MGIPQRRFLQRIGACVVTEDAPDLSHLDEAAIEAIPRVDGVRLAEALRQRLGHGAKARFVSYARYVRPDYRLAVHLERIAEKMEAVERDEFDRLLIDSPPRHGKSLTSSILFPAWYPGKHPQQGYDPSRRRPPQRTYRGAVRRGPRFQPPRLGILFRPFFSCRDLASEPSPNIVRCGLPPRADVTAIPDGEPNHGKSVGARR